MKPKTQIHTWDTSSFFESLVHIKRSQHKITSLTVKVTVTLKNECNSEPSSYLQKQTLQCRGRGGGGSAGTTYLNNRCSRARVYWACSRRGRGLFGYNVFSPIASVFFLPLSETRLDID